MVYSIVYNDCFTFCMSVYHMHAWYLRMSEERVGSLGTGIMGSCEPPYKCWKLYLVPLQVQQVLLTSEPSLQPSCYLLKILFIFL